MAPAFSMAGPVGANAEAWLYYLYRALPIVAAVVMAARWMARGRPADFFMYSLLARSVRT